MSRFITRLVMRMRYWSLARLIGAMLARLPTGAEHVWAQGYLQGGDTYWRYKSFNTVGAGVRFYTENVTVSPYHTQACEDVGRAFIEAVSGRQWRYNRTRFSDLYIPSSDINGLCSFGALNYMDIDRQFGPIVSLNHVGNILLALAWYKAQSFYIKRRCPGPPWRPDIGPE